MKLAAAVGLLLVTSVATSGLAQATRRGNGQRAPRPGLIQGTELVIVATDEGLEAPDQIDAGLVNMRLFNRSASLYRLVLVKVDRLERLSTIADFLRSNPWNVTWLTPLGGPEASVPGSLSTAIAMVEPGRYVLVGLRDSPGFPRLNIDERFLREISVIKPLTPGPTALPLTEISVSLSEWGIRLNGPLHAGRRALRVHNVGRFEHSVWLVRLLPGHTLQEAVRYAETRRGPAPFEAVGGTAKISEGRSINVTVDLLPGEYALICSLYNPLSRRTHSSHGMAIQITVTN
ncbi:MAG: hypothetical protein ACT4OZ_17550 [Gemmatimonadota bacterium]